MTPIMTLTMASGTSKASNGRRMNRSRRASATMPKLKASIVDEGANAAKARQAGLNRGVNAVAVLHVEFGE